ncbi:acyl-CoA carboxylase subunit beta [Catenuloplanes sp. NPDC051500]|uniref:acyl-CoA carboxylase subunit beta n=1 Tax=Catenuloplanes sp. NPDC051500 TaxID=3363959 RepID=UPI003796FE48
MAVLDTAIDPRNPTYQENRDAMLERLTVLANALDLARAGGGERHVTRHHARGRLMPRERIDLLLDQDAPFLELSPVAGWHTDHPVGAGVVTGLGVVEGVECVIVAHDPTVRGGVLNPIALRKIERAGEIALANRLPLVSLVESAGADLPAQAEAFVPGGSVLRDLARLSADRIPTVCVVFGDAVDMAAWLPGLSDYTVLVRAQAKVSVAGPRLVQEATGEVSDGEALGGAAMHANRSGLADFLAEDERDGVRLARQCLRRLNWRKLGPPPRTALPAPPKHDAEDLLAIPSADERGPFDPREVLARIVDGSDFDEFKPGYGPALVTGWAEVHGYPVGVLANARGVLVSAEAQKGAQFIQLANATGTPLVFLQNASGLMTGAEFEQGGIVKHASAMMSAVAASGVPHLAVNLGAAHGAAAYAMSGRAMRPRFLFSWPNARAAALAPAQLTGVLTALARQAAEVKGQRYEEDFDRNLRMNVERQVDAQTAALFVSGRLHDDGVIDPRDTRTVLGLCLSAIHSGPVGGADRFGVFRM